MASGCSCGAPPYSCICLASLDHSKKMKVQAKKALEKAPKKLWSGPGPLLYLFGHLEQVGWECVPEEATLYIRTAASRLCREWSISFLFPCTFLGHSFSCPNELDHGWLFLDLTFYTSSLLSQADVDRIMDALKPTMYPFDLCPSWLVKADSEGTQGPLLGMINLSLETGIFPGIGGSYGCAAFDKVHLGSNRSAELLAFHFWKR